MNTGLFVLMCGDGGNDSVALRTAHVGLSLSKVPSHLLLLFRV